MGRQRLFFALWPDEALRRQLAEVARQFELPAGARRVHADNLHITLAFLGGQSDEARTCLERQAESIRASRFTLTLDRQGFWPKPRVVWIGSDAPPAELLQLAGGLQRAQLACGLEPEARPFHTHLTLLRKVARLPRPIALAPLLWQVSDFALVVSETLPEGARYRVVRRFSLI